MSQGKILSGQTFGRWSVGPRGPDAITTNGRKRRRWVCRCSCGTYALVEARNLRNGKSRGCLQHKKGELNSNWKGGRKLVDGYVYLLRPTHPNARKDGYVTEHRVKMSERLGRPLRKGETVHHRSGRRDQNNIENLELFASAHCPGQRVEDLVAAAEETLRRYKPTALSPAKPLVSHTHFAAVGRG